MENKDFDVAKYYVQSGSFRRIIEAESDRNAAISAVQLAIEQVLPLDGDSRTAQKEPHGAEQKETYSVLSGKVLVSESGFDSSDRLELPTREVITAWNHLITTLDRLEQMIDSAV